MSLNKENIQAAVNKIQVLDFTIDTLGRTHKDDVVKAEELLKRASAHKLKLVEEILRLSNVADLEITQTI